MNQFSWTYVDNVGKAHRVGIAHGAQSGHLLIHVNKKVTLIDFNVLNSTTYPLFINGELFEIAIERKGDKFVYGFKINKNADTPLNRQRKEQEKKHWWQTLAFVGGLLVVISLFVLTMRSGNRGDTRQQFSMLAANQLAETVGKVLIKENAADQLIQYIFIANGKSFTERIESAQHDPNLLFPLEAGDEFVVYYQRENPAVNQLNYRQPTAYQLGLYRERALQQHLALNPNDTKSHAACLISVAEQLKGLEGLALFYFQNRSPEENSQFNSQLYKKMVRDLPFQNQVKKECWNQ